MFPSKVYFAAAGLLLVAGAIAGLFGGIASAVEAEAVGKYISHLWVGALFFALLGRWVKGGEIGQ